MQMERVIVVGGGAAGMAAAIAASSCGDSVTLLERMDRIGKKLLATGNGRCNLMNTGAHRYPGGGAFADAVLAQYGIEEQRRFWQHLGLRLREEEAGRVYPVSGQASTVLDALRMMLDSLHVNVMTGVTVTHLDRQTHGWTVTTDSGALQADRVIVAGGGRAQPKLGSDGSALMLLKGVGCAVKPFAPALTQIVTDTSPIRGLSGIRVKADVAVMENGSAVHREQGELLFADYGVSGVCAMQCARYAAAGRTLRISLTHGMGFESAAALQQELLRRKADWKTRPLADVLTGLCVPRLAAALMRSASWRDTGKSTCGQMTSTMAERLVNIIDDWDIAIQGVKGFESAQVCFGGAQVSAFNPQTMESRTNRGLHAVGEVLDVDGDCGGFNLMFAFGSGIIAGLNGRNAPW